METERKNKENVTQRKKERKKEMQYKTTKINAE